MTKENNENEMATIFPAASFDDAVAAEALDRAFRGDKQKAVEILTRCCNAQRQMIRTPYKVRYGKDLEEELKKNLGGDLEDLAVFLMQTPAKADALELNRAVKGLGTNEKLLIDILTSRTNDEIEAVRNVYQATFNKSLEAAITDDTSGDFRRMLLVLLQGKRDESDHVETYRAAQDAQNIIRSFDKKSGVEKFDGIRPLLVGSPRFIAVLGEEFERVSGGSLEKAIEKNFSGDSKNLLLAAVRLGNGKSRFFAEQIYNATKGLGTKDKDLIRVIVGRAEIDLRLIGLEFEAKYKKPLIEVVREECKGAYRDGLINLIRGNKQF